MESYKATMYGVFRLDGVEQDPPLAIFCDEVHASRWVNDMANSEEFDKADVLVMPTNLNGTYSNGVGEGPGTLTANDVALASRGNTIEAMKCLHDLVGSLTEDQEEDLAEEVAFLERFLTAVEQKLLGQEQSK